MHFQRTTTRRRPRAAGHGLALAAIFAGLLPPTSVGQCPPPPTRPRSAREHRELTIVDEQVHEATITVAAQQDAAEAAAVQAAAAQAALSVFEPQLRAIAQSGYTGKSQSRVAAFLTSDSADELVQQMTTLDMIAPTPTASWPRLPPPRPSPPRHRPTPTPLPRPPRPVSTSRMPSRPRSRRRSPTTRPSSPGWTAAEQATVTAALAGLALRTPSVGSPPPAPGPEAAVAVRTALAQVDDPYVWGASGPDGFDCSGLTSYAYGAAGVALPHSSRSQSALGVDVARADLLPGDWSFLLADQATRASTSATA